MRISEFRNHLKRAIGKGEKNAFIRKNKYNYCVHFMRSSNEKKNAFIQKNIPLSFLPSGKMTYICGEFSGPHNGRKRTPPYTHKFQIMP